MDLTLVIPCFDEGARIDACLSSVTAWVDAQPGLSSEVLVVDDGSGDDTAARAKAWAARRGDVRVLETTVNAGKGDAVRRGVIEAKGDIVVFLDADLAVTVDHVGALLPALRNGVDVAVGCRHVPGAEVEKPQGPVRRALGRGYLVLARWLLDIPVSDVTCGFKGFRRRVAQELFDGAKCRRWGFDAEILHLASRRHYKVLEVPVAWKDGAESRVRLPGDVLKSLAELAAVRWRSSTGVYGPPAPPGTRGPR
jgi:glycosyltransferase involved in cell wall biosynthesis